MPDVTAETPLNRLNWNAISDAALALRDQAVIASSDPYCNHVLRRSYGAIIEDFAEIAALLGHRVEPIYEPGSVMLESEAETVARHIALRDVVLEDFSVTAHLVRAAE